MAPTWRVLSHGPDEGPRNMALDEAVARAVGTGRHSPTIRFYAWAKPTVSVGCLQAARGAVAPRVCRRWGVGVVRRPTGGRAVLHDDELTYSVCIPLDGAWGRLSVAESFRLIGEGIVAGLRRLGIAAALGRDGDAPPVPGPVPACFQMPRMPAVLADGRKLVGSAQRRSEGAILQHGSLLLGVDLALHQAVFPTWPRDDPGRCVTTLRALLPSLPSRAAIERVLLEGWSEVLGVRGAPGELSSSEQQEAEQLVRTRYGTFDWTWRR
jgi:lipoate-protein ligase A